MKVYNEYKIIAIEAKTGHDLQFPHATKKFTVTRITTKK